MVTLDIKHPQAKIYTEKELETIALKLVYSYLDLKSLELEEEKEEQTKLYKIDYRDLTKEEKEKVDKIKKMTNEELEKNFISI